MKHFILLIAFLLVCPLATAHAMSGGSDITVPSAIPDMPGLDRDTGTKITNAETNQRYEECITKPFSMQQLNPISRDLMCSCLATGMQTEMTKEDLANMELLDKPEGKEAFKKMLNLVYFPCAMAPIEETIKSDCQKRAASNGMGNNTVGGCQCLTSRMMGYVRKIGIPQLVYTSETTGPVHEPFDALLNSGSYSQELIRSYYACFNGSLP